MPHYLGRFWPIYALPNSKVIHFYFYPIDDWIFEEKYCFDKITEHFDVKSLKGFGLDHMHTGVVAAGSILHYLNQNQHNKLTHVVSLKRIDESRYDASLVVRRERLKTTHTHDVPYSRSRRV